MTTQEVIRKVEDAQDIYERIQNHVHDIGDIDYMIEELKNKRKVYEKRLRRDSDKLAMVMKNKEFTDCCTGAFINTMNDAISYLMEISNEG